MPKGSKIKKVLFRKPKVVLIFEANPEEEIESFELFHTEDLIRDNGLEYVNSFLVVELLFLAIL